MAIQTITIGFSTRRVLEIQTKLLRRVIKENRGQHRERVNSVNTLQESRVNLLAIQFP